MKHTPPRSTKNRPNKRMPFLDERRWSTASKIVLLIIITVLLIAPFANKAFHIDDPLFLWIAKHIQSHPADPYRINVTWYLDEKEVSQITKNPPLTSYLIALAAYLVGWSERALHLVFLLPGILAVLGTYLLARKLCTRPLMASLVGLITPMFILSSTTIMCDVLMLAFWVWAVLLWVRATERSEYRSFALSALLVAACTLTKYYGMSLLALLPVYTVIKKRKIGVWMMSLLIPILILAWYQWETRALYGRGLLLDAAANASKFRGHFDFGFMAKGLTGLTFMGGCLASLLFFTPFLWSRRVLFIELVVSVGTILAISFIEMLGIFPLHDVYGTRWPQVIQIGMMTMVVVGINLLALTLVDLWNHRGDASSLLLFCWIMGTFIFASFINWSVNGRSILPMAPAFGILLVRRIEQRNPSFRRYSTLLCPLVPAALVALLVTWADYGLANSARSAVEKIYGTYNKVESKLWFQGHWGFQYYMELRGAEIAQTHRFPLAPGDILVVPENNDSTFPVTADKLVVLREIIELFPACRWLTTMNRFGGAGFYSDVWGILPFVIGSVLPERYNILQIESPRQTIRLPSVIDQKREEYDKAIANYTQALFIKLYAPKTFYETFNDRGNVFAKTGEFDRAISDYTQALFIYPYLLLTYVRRGDMYFLKGEYDRAICDYTQALRLDSRNAKTYLRRGEAYFRKGAHDKARNDVKKAESLGFSVSQTLLEKPPKPSDAQR